MQLPHMIRAQHSKTRSSGSDFSVAGWYRGTEVSSLAQVQQAELSMGCLSFSVASVRSIFMFRCCCCSRQDEKERKGEEYFIASYLVEA